MLKGIGLLFVFFATSYLGYMIYMSDKRASERREGLCELVKYIKQRAEFFGEPLITIYSTFKNPSLEESGFMKAVISEGLEAAYIKNKGIFLFDDFVDMAVCSFLKTLGRLPLEEQLSSCEFIISKLEGVNAVTREKLPIKKKLWCSVGVLSGAAIVILIL